MIEQLKVFTGRIKTKGLINKALIKLGVMNKPWNPMNGCTLIQYDSIEDKESLDVILKHVKPNNSLISNGITIRPRKESLQDLNLKQVIWIKNKVASKSIDDIICMIYKIKDTSLCDVFSYTSTCKWIQEELEIIEKKESRLSSKKDKEVWKSAGIEKLQAYGHYTMLFMIKQDVTQEDIILKLPYYRVFDFMECSKDWNDIQNKFQEIKSKQ